MGLKLWEDIPGYEGKYQASRDGYIRRLYKTKEPKVLKSFWKTSLRGGRYQMVNLRKDGKSKGFKVGRLVWLTFVGEPKGNIVHINGLKSDNALDNLKDVDDSTLGRKFGGANKCRKTIAIDGDGKCRTFPSMRECSRQIGVSCTIVAWCCHRSNGYKNQYANGYTIMFMEDYYGD